MKRPIPSQEKVKTFHGQALATLSRAMIPISVQQKRANAAPPAFRPASTRLTPPPVYRPNTAPSLQQKPAGGVRAANVPGGAPPVYRPNAGASLQRKSGGTAPPVYRPARGSVAAPPVYRPKVGASLQQKPGSGARQPPRTPQGQGSFAPAPNLLQNWNFQRTAPAGIAPPVSMSTLIHQTVQMRAATQAPLAASVVQRKVGGMTGFQDLLNEIHEPFRSAITGNRTLTHEIIQLLDEPDELPMRQVWFAIVRHGFREHWTKGIFEGSIEGGLGRNWADIHVTGGHGGLGGHLDYGVLTERLEYIQGIFSMVQDCGGPEGEVELHPTGAVVTKQLIAMLAEGIGTKDDSYESAVSNLKKRKFLEKLSKPKRDKQADKIDADLLPEYFGFLESLRGVQGLRIVPSGAMPLPEGIREMGGDQQAIELERSMTETTLSGLVRMEQYQKAYQAQEMVPSMKVYIKARHIPALLGVLRSFSQ